MESFTHVNSLRPRENDRRFADDVFKCIFLNENVWIPIKISLKFVPKGPINYIRALVQIMAWRRTGDKPLSEPMMPKFNDAYMRHSASMSLHPKSKSYYLCITWKNGIHSCLHFVFYAQQIVWLVRVEVSPRVSVGQLAISNWKKNEKHFHITTSAIILHLCTCCIPSSSSNNNNSCSSSSGNCCIIFWAETVIQQPKIWIKTACIDPLVSLVFMQGFYIHVLK